MSRLELEKKQTFKLMQQDTENNEREQERQKGTPLVYGDTIQFRHKYSNKFLAGSTTKTALLEYNSLRVSLEEESDRSCFFKVMSKFKVRVEGDEVKEGDQVRDNYPIHFFVVCLRQPEDADSGPLCPPPSGLRAKHRISLSTLVAPVGSKQPIYADVRAIFDVVIINLSKGSAGF